MKNFTLSTLLFALFLIPTVVFSNTVIVKGYIKDANNQPVANKTVRIVIDSTLNQSCNINRTRITNPNGYYIDTITCSATITKVKVIVEDCNGMLLINYPQLNTGSNYIESNFIICKTSTTPNPVSCKPIIRFSINGSSVLFNSDSSHTISGDSIVKRHWIFGDGSSADGNKLSLSHNYAKPGKYEACLYIKTARGCESKVCVVVLIPETKPSCQAYFTFEKLAPRKFKFSSSRTMTSSLDSIALIKWVFGDGTILEGKETHTTKEFKDTGSYNVCIKIKTVKGCESSYCATIIVKDSSNTIPPPTCKANFSFKVDGMRVILNSSNSTGDSIIKRYWILGDGKTIETSRIDTSYTYSKSGRYEACLYIKTARGCESKWCAVIEIPEPRIQCSAFITYEKVGPRKFRFSSARSLASTGDTIKTRRWLFGDNTVLEGTEISPLKEFKDTGTYTVCVKIKTIKGCEASYCLTIHVKDSIAIPVPVNCKAYFNYTQHTQLIKFNSLQAGTSDGDSIISRTWNFGDSSALLIRNSKDPSYSYRTPGLYTVCLTIKTKKGCESSYCAKVIYAPVVYSCAAQFTHERIAPRKIRFNSQSSKVLPGDSIVERKWKFGDGTVLTGNVINPLKEFPMKGIYTVCLQIKTAKGCSSEICKVFEIKDSVNTPEPVKDEVKIISLNPNPAIYRLLASIWSKKEVNVEIGIYDIYGTLKWSSKKALVPGNNIVEVPVANLRTGPYFLRVMTPSGRDSKMFYKL